MMLEMLQRANQYIAAETLVAGKHEDYKRPHIEIKIFLQIREKELLKAPNPIKTHPEVRDKMTYCSTTIKDMIPRSVTTSGSKLKILFAKGNSVATSKGYENPRQAVKPEIPHLAQRDQ
ncbi:hypothetical protein BHM03_00018260 [Ensete ventricosum]|nr:hypothetical protein BHM03_00018260 [Ensete ventricosum]